MTPSIRSGKGGARLVALAITGLCLLAADAHAAGRAAAAAPLLRTTLTVRVYDAVGQAGRDLREADRIAAQILRRANVDVTWVHCPRASRSLDANPCRSPLQRDEVVLRLIEAPNRMTRGDEPLGFTSMDAAGRRPLLATVYLDRVHAIARRVKIEWPLLAGRAMAHELGHVLLGTPGHAREGLMRAVWSDDSLRSGAERDWLLMPDDVSAIRSSGIWTVAIERTGGN